MDQNILENAIPGSLFDEDIDYFRTFLELSHDFFKRKI